MIPALPEPAVQLPPGEYSVTTTGELVPFYAAAQLEQYARDYHAAQFERKTVPSNSQEWRGMDGAIAFHLIERHADGWGDVGMMMEEWRAAQMVEADLSDLSPLKGIQGVGL